jgi:hypothetical protein
LTDHEFSYDLLYDGSGDGVVTIAVEVPGAVIMVMGEPANVGGGVVVERCHIEIEPPDSGVLTRKTMRLITNRLMEDFGYEYIVIRGAARTTGARPGHTPRDLRFP